MSVTIAEVMQNSANFEALLIIAETLNQAKYISSKMAHHLESILLGAFDQKECVGFLRVIVQVIGSEEGKTPIARTDGGPLTEGYAEAFGVHPPFRRQGIGQQLQERAITMCRDRGCYQMRSKSPVSSKENYGLKLKMGYGIHPDTEYDAYYFTLAL